MPLLHNHLNPLWSSFLSFSLWLCMGQVPIYPYSGLVSVLNLLESIFLCVFAIDVLIPTIVPTNLISWNSFNKHSLVDFKSGAGPWSQEGLWKRNMPIFPSILNCIPEILWLLAPSFIFTARLVWSLSALLPWAPICSVRWPSFLVQKTRHIKITSAKFLCHRKCHSQVLLSWSRILENQKILEILLYVGNWVFF